MAVGANEARQARMQPEVDYYAILQVHPTAHAEVIKRAYRTILGVLGAHPDHGGSHDYAVQVNAAYAILADPDLRRAYDAARRRLALRQRLREVAGCAYAARRGDCRTVHCRWCGTRNRLPRDTDLRYALCCRCHGLLTSGW